VATRIEVAVITLTVSHNDCPAMMNTSNRSSFRRLRQRERDAEENAQEANTKHAKHGFLLFFAAPTFQ
jgi:hypothetical protein